MTLEEIYFISQSIAAVAVIAFLVYLALQTRQAAKNSRAAMHESRAATELHHIDTMTDREFHPIWAKGNAAAADLSRAFQADAASDVLTESARNTRSSSQ